MNQMKFAPTGFQVAVAAGFSDAQAQQIMAAADHLGLQIMHGWQANAVWQVLHGLH